MKRSDIEDQSGSGGKHSVMFRGKHEEPMKNCLESPCNS